MISFLVLYYNILLFRHVRLWVMFWVSVRFSVRVVIMVSVTVDVVEAYMRRIKCQFQRESVNHAPIIITVHLI